MLGLIIEKVSKQSYSDFLSEHNLEINELKYWEAEYIPYGTLKVLFKHHFDVFGLIVEKLAININEINN